MKFLKFNLMFSSYKIIEHIRMFQNFSIKEWDFQNEQIEEFLHCKLYLNLQF